MKIEDVKKNVFSMPLVSPTANRIPYKFTNREYFIIDYIADIETLKICTRAP
ncbi:hypothetical protein ACP8HZ_07210 [Francisella noatunensis]